jgi:hypothetical protein
MDRKEIFNSHVSSLLKTYIDRIETRLVDAPDPTALLGREIELVESWIDPTGEDFLLPFQTIEGGIRAFSSLGQKEEIQKAFQRLVEENRNIYGFVTDEWTEKEPQRVTAEVVAVFLYRYKKYLLERLSELKNPQKKVKLASDPQEPTIKVWALYYWYKWQVGLHPELNPDGEKKKSFKDLAEQHGVSEQKLYQTFNAVGRNSDLNPKRNPDNIRKVIPLLAKFPEAQQLAKDDLEKRK